jgi:hypothetical protein
MPHFRAKPSKSLGTDAIPPPLQAEVEHYPQPPLCPVIRALEPHLINQIAAGEVVERPAAALKELMENALDAGASRLTLQWRQGGQSLLSVQDNGCGMAPQDLLLALQRHTTSKLPDGDLWAISSFGFRGEALAAIASTARIKPPQPSVRRLASTDRIGNNHRPAPDRCPPRHHRRSARPFLQHPRTP